MRHFIMSAERRPECKGDNSPEIYSRIEIPRRCIQYLDDSTGRNDLFVDTALSMRVYVCGCVVLLWRVLYAMQAVALYFDVGYVDFY